MNVCIPGGWGFLFDVSMQIIFFGNLCEILFLSPEQKQNCSLIFPKLVVLFSGEFGCVSVPHIPLFLFSGLLKLLFLPDLLYQGQYLMEVLEFIRLVHCFCIESKIKSMVDPLAICLVSLASIK